MILTTDASFLPSYGHDMIPYQSFTGADCSSSSHIGGFHCAKEVAGVPLRETMLGPVGSAVPLLQDVVA